MRTLIFSLLFCISVAFLVTNLAHAALISSAKSNTNSFTTAEDFSITVAPTLTPTPTEGEENPEPSVNPGDVVINEVMWGGSTASGSADEWIELRNMTNDPIDISGWTIDALGTGISGIITISPGKSIPGNGYFILANDPKESSILDINPADINPSISLTTASELLVLKKGTAVIDSAGFSGGPWFGGANSSPGPAKSMERKNPPSDGTISTNWETANSQSNLDIGVTDSGTPGADN